MIVFYSILINACVYIKDTVKHTIGLRTGENRATRALESNSLSSTRPEFFFLEYCMYYDIFDCRETQAQCRRVRRAYVYCEFFILYLQYFTVFSFTRVYISKTR